MGLSPKSSSIIGHGRVFEAIRLAIQTKIHVLFQRYIIFLIFDHKKACKLNVFDEIPS